MLKLRNGNCIIFLHYFSLKCEIRNMVFQYFNNVYSFTGKKKERKKEILLCSVFSREMVLCLSQSLRGSFQGWSNYCTVLERLPLIRLPNRVPQNKIKCLFSVFIFESVQVFFRKNCFKGSVKFSMSVLGDFLMQNNCRIPSIIQDSKTFWRMMHLWFPY